LALVREGESFRYVDIRQERRWRNSVNLLHSLVLLACCVDETSWGTAGERGQHNGYTYTYLCLELDLPPVPPHVWQCRSAVMDSLTLCLLVERGRQREKAERSIPGLSPACRRSPVCVFRSSRTQVGVVPVPGKLLWAGKMLLMMLLLTALFSLLGITATAAPAAASQYDTPAAASHHLVWGAITLEISTAVPRRYVHGNSSSLESRVNVL